jgi:hypothetical protein
MWSEPIKDWSWVENQFTSATPVIVSVAPKPCDPRQAPTGRW